MLLLAQSILTGTCRAAVVAGGTTLPVRPPPALKCPRVSHQGRKPTERVDAPIYCKAITRLCSLLYVQPHQVRPRSLGVLSAYMMVYNSRFLYVRNICQSPCLQESDVSVICHHPISILCHNQIQYFAYASTGKEK